MRKELRVFFNKKDIQETLKSNNWKWLSHRIVVITSDFGSENPRPNRGGTTY
jgi:hypothetical protein